LHFALYFGHSRTDANLFFGFQAISKFLFTSAIFFGCAQKRKEIFARGGQTSTESSMLLKMLKRQKASDKKKFVSWDTFIS